MYTVVKELGVDIQNVRAMDMTPEGPDEFVSMEQPSRKAPAVEAVLVFSGEAFIKLVNYPVIVEAWEKIHYGRHRRAWLRDFSEAERNKLAGWRGRFYRWHLATGTPLRVSCRPETLELLQRAVAWFHGMR